MRHDFATETDYQREAKRRYRARQGDTKGRASLPFVGIDGEGGNLPTGHEYLLLRAGSQTLSTGNPLTTRECLRFLAGLPTDVNYIGYFFGYDVTMMLRGMPEERVRRLLNRGARTMKHGGTMPLDYGPYEMDYLPNKEFKIRRKGNPWVVINDVGSFFQCSFYKALTLWDIGTPEQRESIRQSKAIRSDFTELTAETDDYNALEIDLLEQLMEAFREVCIDVGYVPNKWQGPGNLATAMFRRHGVRTRKNTAISENLSLMQFANNAYYGGRFEVTNNGLYTGTTYQYDICSAYPSAMLELPCLQHGEWLQTSTPDKDSIYVAYGKFQATSTANLYSFPIRDTKGAIYYPTGGNGWYWSPEIRAARHQSFQVYESYQYVQACDCQPFGWVPEVYAERLSLGKSARGNILKLGLNSLYGKLAQSVGAAPYANPIWAGLITSITRAKLLDLICEGHGQDEACNSDVLMLATDGVFTTSPRSPEVGKDLGLWEADEHPNGLLIVMPGVYFFNAGGTAKTRGIPLTSVHKHRDAFYHYSHTRRAVSVPLTNFIGLRQALHRNSYTTLAGHWQEVDRQVTWDIASKRDPLRNNAPYIDNRQTIPYSKAIGAWRDESRLVFTDQPDWTMDHYMVGDGDL